MKKSKMRRFTRPLGCHFLFICALLVPVAVAFPASGQEKRRLPRIGIVKNLTAATVDFPEGCGNHFLRLSRNAPARSNIFVASRDDSPAWMNLDGNDVRLEPVKRTSWYRHFHPFIRLEYRFETWRVIVSFENPRDYFDKYAARIIFRNKTSSRTIRLVGFPVCRTGETQQNTGR